MDEVNKTFNWRDSCKSIIDFPAQHSFCRNSCPSQVSVNEYEHQKTVVEHHSVGHLSFIGEQRIANDAIFNGTPVGGLSGIDYDPQTKNGS